MVMVATQVAVQMEEVVRQTAVQTMVQAIMIQARTARRVEARLQMVHQTVALL